MAPDHPTRTQVQVMPEGYQPRQRYDRRSWNSVWESLRFHGRRRGARRFGEGEDTYVDQPTRRVIILSCVIMGCSILDALLTLLYIERGGSEANPAMALAIDYGLGMFVGIKMVMTIFGVCTLALHQNFRLGLRGLYGMAILYAILLIYHGFIWLGELQVF